MMKISHNTRFVIYKNAIDFISSSSGLIERKDICKKESFSLNYNGDVDFKYFFRIDSQKLKIIVDNYNEIDLLLQNILWEDLFFNLKNTIFGILEKILKNKNKKLSIINISPLEGRILGKTLETLGFKNVVFNFNRSLQINSTFKTLEAVLYLFSFQNSTYFQNQTQKIVDEIKKENFDLKFEDNYIIIDENNDSGKYEYSQIDDYLKNQIGLKEPKNIYRIDKYPTEDFLLKKDINEILVLDNDDNHGLGYTYYQNELKTYQNELKTIKLKKENYYLIPSPKIGYYEDYLISKNKEYKDYKKEIEQKAYNSYKIYDKVSSGNNDFQTSSNKPRETYLERKNDDEKYKLIPYFFILPILFIAFIISDLSGSGSVGNGNVGSGGGSAGSYIGNTFIPTTNFGGSSIGNSSSDKSSIIKSFGGGGFSKGST